MTSTNETIVQSATSPRVGGNDSNLGWLPWLLVAGLIVALIIVIAKNYDWTQN